MSKSLIEKLTETSEDRRLLQQERTVLAVTELICALMEEEDVSRTELAGRLEVSKAHVTQLLDGQRNMTIHTVSDVLYHLNHALAVSAEKFEIYMSRFSEDAVFSVTTDWETNVSFGASKTIYADGAGLSAQTQIGAVMG